MTGLHPKMILIAREMTCTLPGLTGSGVPP
jgi:hypothetical protein